MTNHSNEVLFEDIFSGRLKDLKNSCINSGESIILSHVGFFNQDIVNQLSSETENKLLELGVNKKLNKKLFNIVIETLQNIIIHGQKDESGAVWAYYLITKKDNTFVLYSANLVTNQSIEKMTTKLSKIKSLSLNDLKALYMDILSNGALSEKGGAGLGFITMAIKSDNHLNYEFKNLNNTYSIFSIQLKVTE